MGVYKVVDYKGHLKRNSDLLVCVCGGGGGE